jgi:hypothetical protein
MQLETFTAVNHLVKGPPEAPQGRLALAVAWLWPPAQPG